MGDLIIAYDGRSIDDNFVSTVQATAGRTAVPLVLLRSEKRLTLNASGGQLGVDLQEIP